MRTQTSNADRNFRIELQRKIVAEDPLFVPEEADGIQGAPAELYFVVEMNTGGAARGPDVSHDVASLDLLSHFDVDLVQMAIAGHDTETVAEVDQSAGIRGASRRGSPRRRWSPRPWRRGGPKCRLRDGIPGFR